MVRTLLDASCTCEQHVGSTGGVSPARNMWSGFFGLGGGVGSVSSWLRLAYIVYVLHWSTRFLVGSLGHDSFAGRPACLGPMLLEKQSKVTVVGGDQGTESLAAVMKKSLRRMGLLGRCDAKLNASTLKASQRCGSANILGWTQCSRLSGYIEKLCKTLVRQLPCILS